MKAAIFVSKNCRVGRDTPCVPSGSSELNCGAHGVTRPTTVATTVAADVRRRTAVGIIVESIRLLASAATAATAVPVWLLIGLGLCLAADPAAAQAPAWWTNRLVITNVTASDYSPANQGQAKWIATNAYAEFLDKLPGDGNTNIMNVVTNFTTNGNYLPINLGQVKALAKPFYDRIQEASTNGYAYVTNARPIGVTNTYPWTTTTNDDSNYAVANIGQLKFTFSFNFDRNNDGVPDWDSDGDGIPDSWEIQYFGNLNQAAAEDADGDGLTNLQEYQLGTVPNNPDADLDGLSDEQEITGSTDPHIANSPAILSQPQSQTVETGASVSFNVVMTGYVTENFRYQWWFEGQPLSDATNASIFFDHVEVTNAGSYWVVVSNLVGGVSSTPASLAFLQVALPSFSPDEGVHAALPDGVIVTCATDDATMRYTLDGNDPTENDAPIASGSSIPLAWNSTLKVRAFKSGLTPSPIKQGDFSIRGGFAAGDVDAYASLALRSDGRIYSWGNNASGQLGDGTTTARSSIKPVVNQDSFLFVSSYDFVSAAGFAQVLGAQADPVSQYLFGRFSSSLQYNLTHGGSIGGMYSELSGILQGVSIYDATRFAGVALSQETVWWLSQNPQGYDKVRLNRLLLEEAFPTLIVRSEKLAAATAISVGGLHCLALKSDGTVWTWGNGGYGQLGVSGEASQNANHFTPVQSGRGSLGSGSGPLAAVTAISAGHVHSLALMLDTRLASWGDDYYGQLGRGNTRIGQYPRSGRSPGYVGPTYLVGEIPVTVPSTGFSMISGGKNHVAAVKSGDASVWGDDWWFQLHRSVPLVNGLYADSVVASVTGLTSGDIKSVAAGQTVSLALKNDGTIWAWGGDGSHFTYNGSAPAIQVAGSGYTRISLGAGDKALAIKADGTVWTWNARITPPGGTRTTGTPVQVAGLADIVQVSSGYDHYMALDADGKVWTWGANGYGQLGNGPGPDRSTPSVVNGLHLINWDDRDYDGIPSWQELESGTNPKDPASVVQKRLGYWQFEDSAFVGEQGQEPRYNGNVQNVSGLNGNALQVDSGTPATLRYEETEMDGSANINCRLGSVRFWFSPSWTSADAGGSGPGEPGSLINVGGKDWQLWVSATGNQLMFTTYGDGTLATADVAWTANQWHQICLTYGGVKTVLYIDGVPVASGSTALYYPDASTRSAAGINVGSLANGMNPAKGRFDELETFNYILSPSQVSTVVSVAATDPDAAEPADPGVFTITRTGATTTSLTVPFTMSGDAVNGTDYVTIPGSIVIPSGSASATVTLTPIDNTAINETRHAILTVSDSAGYAIGGRTATVTLSDDDTPTVSVTANDPAAAEPANTGQYTITRTGSTTAALPVSFSMGGPAVNGTDYNLNSGSPVSIPIGSSSVTVTLTPIDNATINGNRDAVLSLVDSAAYAVGTRTATVTISDDELPTVSVSASDPNAGEPADTGQYTITRTGPTTAALPVSFSMGGTAVKGTDYNLNNSPVSIPIGSSSVTVTLTPIDNATVNGTRSAILSLVDNAAYVVGTRTATVTISDNELPTVSVTANDPNAAEPADTGQYTITRTGPTTTALPVSFSMGGTAVSGTDYNLSSGSPVAIPVGSSSATVTLTPVDNSAINGSRSAILSLVDNAAYVVDVRTATVTISDNDVPTISVTANDASAAEPANTGQYTITRTGPTTAALSVSYSMGGTGVSGTDYNLNNGSPVSIPIGSASVTVTLTPIDNTVINGSRSAILSLVDNAAYVVGTRTAIVTISDNELPTVSASVSDPIVYENGTDSGHITFTRTGPTGYALPVNFTTSGAVNGTDYATIASPVIIPIGAPSTTVAIDPIDNGAVNPVLTATVTIAPNAEYIVSATDPSGEVLILDNELAAITVSATVANAQEPANAGTFTLSRSQNVSQPVSVYYKLGGMGRNGIDFATLNGKVDFTAGQSSRTVQVQPIDNTRFDGTRDVVLEILPGLDYVDGTPSSATVLLADNEVPPIQVFTSVEQAKEGATPIPGVYTFKRFGSTRSALTVSFTLSGAVAGTDYQTLPTTTVTLPADAAETTLNIVPVNDAIPRGTRSLLLTLQANAAYSILPNWNTATVKIVDDELPTVSVSAFDAVASETSPNKGTFRFTRPATDTGAALKIVYETYYSDPVNRKDYNYVAAATEEATIPAGQTFVDVDIVPVDDTVAEYTETVVARIMGSTEYLVGTAYRATISILDNEPLTYSWEATRPNGVTLVNSGISGVSPQSGVPGEILVSRVGLLPATAVTLTTDFQGGTPGYTPRLVFEGNVLTLLEPSTTAASPTISFPAGANEIRIPIGHHITAKVGTQVPFVNGAVYIKIPSLFGAQANPINFTYPGHVFSIAKLSEQVAEGGAANLFRISRSVDGTSLYYAAYTVSGLADSGADHNVASSYVAFAATDRFKDINVAATSDTRNYEGWESVRLTLDPLQQLMILGSPTEAQAFIRDSSLPVNAVPPVDTDRDGLLDVFESANAFNPNVADVPGTDTDHDGASDLDEQTFGLNPRVPLSNGSGITDGAVVSQKRGALPTLATVPIKFATASCVGCHQTTLKAGPYEVTSKKPSYIAGYAPGTRPPNSVYTRLEKIINVEVGKSYQVEIKGPIREHAQVNVSTYTAEILATDPNYPNFILDDPSGLLGVDRATGGIDTKTANLIVPKLEITWVTKPNAGNLELDDNPNTGGGKRIFVGSKSPSDTPSRRNIVTVKVKTTPALPGKRITLRALDVDDATPRNVDTIPEGVNEGQAFIDISDAGNDNEPDPVTPTSGYFLSSALTTVSGLLDANGEAQFDFQVCMQPGNNYRVAATVFPVNDATLQLANVNRLQVATPTGNYYVPAVGDDVKGGFNGVLSLMLTVWRKLHLEFDSMTAVTGNSKIGTSGSISQNVVKNQSTVTMSVSPPLAPSETELENGTLNIGGNSYHIINNYMRAAGRYNYHIVIVNGLVPTIIPAGSSCSFKDDDDYLLTEAGLPASLPKLASLPTIVPKLQPLFAPAYIVIVDANAGGWNTPKGANLPFILNEAPLIPNNSFGTSSYDNFKDTVDSLAFWSHLVSFGYQSDSSEDGDPSTGADAPLYGGTPKNALGKGVSVILVEAIREKWESGYKERVIPPSDHPEHQDLPNAREIYWNFIAGDILHEIGHSPGGYSEGSDHIEFGVMAESNIEAYNTARGLTDQVAPPYSPMTIKRFRRATSWLP